MNTVEEIIDVWKSIGWNTLADYNNRKNILQQEGENDETWKKFDPDVINNKLFWKAAHIHFGCDPVATGVEDSINTANSNNHILAKHCGALQHFDIIEFNHERRNISPVNICEIGCGYGSFKEHFINSRPYEVRYEGYDILCRKAWVQELSDNGTFTDAQLLLNEKKFDIIYSNNVFQHLSPKIILDYVNQFSLCCKLGSYVVIGYCVNIERDFSFHYGQMVKLLSINDFAKIFNSYGFRLIANYNLYVGGLMPVSFLFQKVK